MTAIWWTLQNIFQSPLRNLLDIAIVAALFFGLFRLVRGTRAVTLLRGVAILLVVAGALSSILQLRAFAWLLSRMLTALAIAIPVIFQPELRRLLDRVGRFGISLGPNKLYQTERERLIGDIAEAAEILSRRRHGALIVLERETGLQEYIDSGVPLMSELSSQLLLTIFFPNTDLHDGAVILRSGKLMAASCVLPLSTSRRIATQRRTGLRHRAAMGISEVSDAVCVIVSEETGTISLVHNGQMYRGLDNNRLTSQLQVLLPNAGMSALSRMMEEGLRQLRRGSTGQATAR